MIKIEYMGERTDGHVCKKCGGFPVDPTQTTKRIFGTFWKKGRPQEVSEFDWEHKYQKTGLFKVVK